MGLLHAFSLKFGYLGIALIIFFETSFFTGFFLPGDTLLFTAGFLASLGYFDVRYLILWIAVAAILGDTAAYAAGKYFGPWVFRYSRSRFLKPENVEKAEVFFRKYGGLSVFFARFLPFLRTAAPVSAGVARMSYPLFFFFNVIGGIVWATSLTLLGYYLGKSVPHADRYFLIAIVAVIAASVLPAVIGYWRRHRARLSTRFS